MNKSMAHILRNAFGQPACSLNAVFHGAVKMGARSWIRMTAARFAPR